MKAARRADRAVRVTLALAPEGADVPSIVVEPAGSPGRPVEVNGVAVEAELLRLGGERAILARGGDGGTRDRVLLPGPAATPASAAGAAGIVRQEVIIGGWRFELDVEPAARAALRDRARRARADAEHSGPTDVRAMIPGVVVSVSVNPGDIVTAGQQLLVLEAMKMQNELRASRAGTIERVTVGAGQTIEVGDLLVVIG
jgi:pyruvate carboxylase subunit B